MRSSRNHQFDLLRIVFSILVLLTHAPQMVDGNDSRELLMRFTRSPISLGSASVDGFFLLSGYLVVQSWVRWPAFGSYFRNRMFRIVPAYLVASVLSIVIVGYVAAAGPGFFKGLDLRSLWSVALLSTPLTPAVFPHLGFHLVNGPLWTIAYEVKCYLLLALLGMLKVLRRPRLVLAGAAVLAIPWLSPWVLRHVEWHRMLLVTGECRQLSRLGTAFLIGASFWLNRDSVVFRRWMAVVAAVLLVASAASAVLFEPALMTLGGYLMFYFGQSEVKWLGWMARVPDISYGLYLYGWPVEGLLIFYGHGSPWKVFAESAVICVVLGWMSWRLVEAPVLRRKKVRPADRAVKPEVEVPVPA